MWNILFVTYEYINGSFLLCRVKFIILKVAHILSKIEYPIVDKIWTIKKILKQYFEHCLTIFLFE